MSPYKVDTPCLGIIKENLGDLDYVMKDGDGFYLHIVLIQI